MKQQFNFLITAIILIVGTTLFTACGNSDTFIDSRDGQKYKTVKIGEQIWMAENLRYKTENAKCPDNDPELCQQYGSLYNATYLFLHDKDFIRGMIWYYQKGNPPLDACPEGWRLPDENDFRKLITYTDSITQKKIGTGKALKSKEGWKEANGIDAVGFNAKPAFKDEQKVSYLAIPILPPLGNDGIVLDKSVNIELKKMRTDIYKKFDSEILEAVESYNQSIRCIKKDSIHEKGMQTFLAQFFNNVVESIEKNLNDSLKISSGLWSEQQPITQTNYRIYFDVDKEYYEVFSDRMRKSNISIENKVGIKDCPSQSKWTFMVERLGDDNIYLSKYKCTLIEPENEACKKLVSRDVVSKLNNDDCINIQPNIVEKGKDIKKNKTLDRLLSGKE